ncbi:MAG: PHP domain-containing protein [Kiritimatiellia bacterium]
MSGQNDQARRFRYDTSGNWYKGNTHIHTNASDGGMSTEQIESLYRTAGYDFLFATDHARVSSFEKNPVNGELLWMDGVELDGADDHGSYFHVVCLGAVELPPNSAGLLEAMAAARKQGALLILAHPFWTGNSWEDALRWQFHGVEVYNHVCRWLNGKGESMVHWNAMLHEFPETLAFAADDAHLRPEHPGWNGGWVMVNAPSKTPAALMESIRRGNFYSTCGPEIYSICIQNGQVLLETSPIQFARLVGPGSKGQRRGSFGRQRFKKVAFDIPNDWNYAYIEIEDGKGKRAWTNGLFVT